MHHARASLRPYRSLAAAGWRRWSAYRAATVAGALTNTVFGFVKASIAMAAVASAGGSLAGYDAREVATYTWLTQGLLAPMAVFAWSDLAERVRTGDVAVDLARPADLQLSWLATDLGRAAFVLLPRGLPPVLVGALTTGLSMPSSPLTYLIATASVAVGVALSFAGRFLMNLAAFWLLDYRGVVTLYMVASTVLSGLIIPVHWFPAWLGTLASLTYFPSILQTPVDVLSGRAQGADALGLLAVQVAWLAVTLAAGRLVLRRATRRLVVQGG
jgi:ABC-2 type transport system permease protein